MAPRRLTAALTGVATSLVTACSGTARPAADYEAGPTFAINLDQPDGRPSPSVFGDIYAGPGTNGGTMREDNVRVGNGVLTISAHGSDLGGACMCGPDAPKMTYGIYEFSFRADVGAGYIPVVMLWPQDDEDKSTHRLWLEGGELDILELEDGDRQRSTISLHYFDPWGSSEENHQRVRRDVHEDFTRFHQVRVVFTPDRLSVAIDGAEIFVESEPARIPPRAMHIAAQIDLHWDEARQPNAESAERGTRMELADIRYRPIRGVTLNPDGTAYASRESPGAVITLG